MLEPLPGHAADLSPDVEALARLVVDRGLAVPAMFFLAMHRPLAHVSSQAMIVGGGVLMPLLGLDRFQALQETLADGEKYDALLDRLEALALEARALEAQAVEQRQAEETR
jgi:hypothetical protein